MIRVPLTAVRSQLELLGACLPPLALRLLLAWEFLESGIEKWRGENWFVDIQSDFPLPFNLIPASINWTMATVVELAGALLLLVGLGTRMAAASLLLVTVVATSAVHWPMEPGGLADLAMGYAITDTGFGNFKLPLLFMVMLLPLVFSGGGRLSLDALLVSRQQPAVARLHPATVPALLVACSLPLAWLLPPLAVASLAVGLLGAAWVAWQVRVPRSARIPQ